MATDLQALLDYRDDLLSCLGSGTLQLIDQNGEKVTYRSTAEMVQALRVIDSQIARAQRPAKTKRAGITYLRTSKGI